MAFAMRVMLGLLGLTSAVKFSDEARANPIRKVVNMMQKMQTEIEKEGEEEKELYDKFMCHCKSELADFNKGKDEFEGAVPKLKAEIEATQAQISQLAEEIKAQKAEEAQAVGSMESATGRRDKEHEHFEDEVSELKVDISAIDNALPALDQAMHTGGALLQSTSSKVMSLLSSEQIARLEQVVAKGKKASTEDRQLATSFLEGKAKANGIGEVKAMLVDEEDEMKEEVSDDKVEEKKELNIFQQLMEAKTTEKDSIEDTLADKIDRLGSLKVSLVELKGQASDAVAAVGKDFDLLQKLSDSCAAKTKEFDARVKTQQEELTALHETIKILNDDDNLDLFNKALPSPSLLQLHHRSEDLRRQALDVLRSVPNSTTADMLLLALSHKGVDFAQVQKMIDDMVTLLKQEQKDDVSKKEYCEKQSFELTSKTKALTHRITNLKDALSVDEDSLESVSAEITEMQKGITALDKSVAESTEMRQEEHAEYQKTVQEQAATKQVLQLAQTRMNAFYHPELTPTTTTPNPYSLDLMQQDGKTKTNSGNAVLRMLQELITETDKTVAEAEFDEKDAQKFYEDLLSDSKSKREADSQAIVDKQKMKAELETDKVKKSTAAAAESKELEDVEDYGKKLHEQCDWLLQNFETRKDARATEQETLVNAKGILAGA